MQGTVGVSRSAACLGVLVALLLAAVAQRAHASNCAGFDTALADVSAAHGRLTALPLSDELDPFLLPPAQRGIEDSKVAIARLVRARMACARDEGTRDIEADFTRAMQTIASACDEHCKHSEYEPAPTFAVTSTPDHHPELLAIKTTLAIECGHDSGLFVYERAGDVWRERVHWQSAPYDKVSGALEAFDFRIAPADTQGNWYVLVADIMPWCSSTWSTIRYTALRPATDHAAQKVLLSDDAEIWWGSDDFGRIQTDVDSFDVRFHSYSIDLGVHNREWIRHYAIRGDSVRRVQPVANSARDFADEWIVSPWTQARDWSHPKMLAALEKWHERMRGKKMPNYEFMAIHACYDHPHHFEVDMIDERDQAEYFLSIEGRSIFTLSGVALQSNPSCKGDNLIDEMQTR